MVKLSDALRGAADRAPLDGVSVDAHRAARRASTQRGLRAGAGGVLGAGMVAVLAVGIAGPSGLVAASTDEGGRDTSAMSGGEAALDGAAPEAAGSSLAWGLCGQELPFLTEVAAPVTLSVTLPSEEASGDALEATVTTTVVQGGTFETFGLDGVILWDGIVVGTIDGAPGEGVARELTAVELVEGEETTTVASVPLVNCWDGEALPASKYELVLSEEYWATVVVEEPPLEPPVGEPTLEPTEPVEPTLDPTGPTDPTEPTEPGSVEPAPADDATDDAGAAESGIAEDPDTTVSSDAAVGGAASSIAAGGLALRAVAPAVGFVIPGDAVDEPFAAYLAPAPDPEPTEPVGQPPLPDGALDPATARALYREGLAGAWDMAPGTTRWIATSDSEDPNGYRWFGCAYEDEGGFPEESAVMDLLSVTVGAPRAIDVSYGWIVEDNPRVTTTLTNTSEWDLTGFWGRDSVQLMLVRDGRVVAEAYPVNPDQNRIAYAEDAAAAEGGVASSDSAMSIWPAPSSGLAAGETSERLFLWRDVNSCWTSTGQEELRAGTYTLLAGHYLSVGGGVAYLDGADAVGEPEPFILEESGGGTDAFAGAGGSDGLGDATDPGAALTDDAAEPDIAIAPAPGYDTGYDAIEFQIWTSVGEVRVG